MTVIVVVAMVMSLAAAVVDALAARNGGGYSPVLAAGQRGFSVSGGSGAAASERVESGFPLVVAHRGASGYRPEHTAAAYLLAMQMGADAVEPDVVASSDGVLVIRHENELSETTDVADRAEFADRRTTKTIDGRRVTGWFTEDFTWAELQTLRCREKLPGLRPQSAAFDGAERMLSLPELLKLVKAEAFRQEREIGVAVEIKHATYFAGIDLDLVRMLERDLHANGWAAGELPLMVQSFESTPLIQLRDRGIRATFVYLIADSGVPADLSAVRGARARSYVANLTERGLDDLVGIVDGIGLSKSVLLDRGTKLVPAAQERGLRVYAWTWRAENAFLDAGYRQGAPADFGRYDLEWSMLAALGLDAVFTDHPDLALEFFGR